MIADLQEIRALAAQTGDEQLNSAIARLDHAIEGITNNPEIVTALEKEAEEDDESYLNSELAAIWLGIPSELLLKLLVRKQGLKHKIDEHGFMLISLSELEKIENSEVVEHIRMAHREHLKTLALWAHGGFLTDEESEEFAATLPPGPFTWKVV